MGHVNVIWQGDANRAALALLPHASSPPCVVNVTGPAALSVRVLAAEFGRRFGRAPIFEGSEAPDALLTNTSRMQSLLGAPAMTIDTMIDWTAAWVRSSMPVLGAETHFSARDGRF